MGPSNLISTCEAQFSWAGPTGSQAHGCWPMGPGPCTHGPVCQAHRSGTSATAGPCAGPLIPTSTCRMQLDLRFAESPSTCLILMFAWAHVNWQRESRYLAKLVSSRDEYSFKTAPLTFSMAAFCLFRQCLSGYTVMQMWPLLLGAYVSVRAKPRLP